MKRLLFLFFLLLPLSAGAQAATYDTMEVSPDGKRNVRPDRVSDAKAADTPLRGESTRLSRRQPTSFDRNKLRFGANLGLSLSKNYTNLGVGPQIGCQFNKYFMAGAGIKYYFTNIRTSEYVLKNNLLGTNIFGYFYPINFIVLFAQPEINYIWSALAYQTTNDKITDRGLAPSLVAGAGFRLGGSHITLNYDLMQHANSPHPDGFYLGVSAFF